MNSLFSRIVPSFALSALSFSPKIRLCRSNRCDNPRRRGFFHMNEKLSCSRFAIISTIAAFSFLPVFGQGTGSSCLVFRPDFTPGDTLIKGMVINGCVKPVMAYSLSAVSSTGAVMGGTTEDHLMGAAGVAISGQATPGVGPILLGEQRRISEFGIVGRSTGARIPNGLTVLAIAVVFDDATALGDEETLQRVFSRRNDDLAEWKFWEESVGTLKTKLSRTDSLARIVDLANVSAREKRLGLPARANRVRANAEVMRSQLQALDSTVTSGRITRDQAIQFIEASTSAHVADFQKNATRRIQ